MIVIMLMALLLVLVNKYRLAMYKGNLIVNYLRLF